MAVISTRISVFDSSKHLAKYFQDFEKYQLAFRKEVLKGVGDWGGGEG